MNIEILTSYFEPYKGGIENVVLHYANGLGKLGHNVYVHTAHTTPNNVYKNLPEYEESKYYKIRRYNIYPYSLFFPKLFSKDSVLSLHNYSCLMNDYAAIAYRNRKKVLSPYGNISYDIDQRRHPHLAPIYDNYIGKRTLSIVDKIVAMTKLEKDSIAEKYPHLADKLRVVPAGIDFYTKKKRPAKFQFYSPYFISVGRITRTKRFEDVFHILKAFPKYHYVLAGRDIGHAGTLQKIATELNVQDRFHYVGEVTEDEKVSLLSDATVFIMPDSANAFGIANLEAFYYLGKVVAARSGGMTELSNMLGGETFSIANYEELISAVKKELKKKIDIKEKQKKIKMTYSWDSIVRQYEKILLE